MNLSLKDSPTLLRKRVRGNEEDRATLEEGVGSWGVKEKK